MATERYDGHLCHEPATDGAVAEPLHTGLERLASSWRKRRALRIHRGAAGPEELARCEWVVLLASPGAARSADVEAQLEWWLAERGPGTILPVLVDGTWTWDEASRDFRWDEPAAVSAVPLVLRGVFGEEPRHMDLSWATDDPDLTLRNARFRDQVAELAAPMHGVTKEDLEGEDVRQQRRTRRMARRAVVSMALLAVIALVAAAFAVSAQREADEQREIADVEAARAAERAREATGRRLATVATSDADLAPDLRLLLAAEAARLAPGPQADAALFRLLADPELSDVQTPVLGTGVRSDFTALTGHDLGFDPSLVMLDGGAGVVMQHRTGGISRFVGPDWTVERSDLAAGSSLLALGGGRFAMYSDDSNLSPPVLVDLDSGEEKPLPTEIGSPPGRGGRGVGYPQPVKTYRFSDDGGFLVAFSQVGSRLFSVPTGAGDPVAVETAGTVFDFGLVDGSRAWQLTAGALQIVDLVSGDIIEEYRLGDIDGVIAADVDLERGIAVVGSAPSTYTVLDLESGEVLARRDTGTEPAEIAIGPDGRWLAAAGPNRAQLLVLENVTPIGSAPTRFVRIAGPAAGLAFDPDGRYLLIRPLNASPAKVFVFSLETDQWYRAACASAGRALTEAEWDEYVGLPDGERACSTPEDRETTIAVTAVEEPSPTTTMATTTTTTTTTAGGPGPDCSRIEPAILEQIFPDGNYDEQLCRNYMGEGG